MKQKNVCSSDEKRKSKKSSPIRLNFSSPTASFAFKLPLEAAHKRFLLAWKQFGDEYFNRKLTNRWTTKSDKEKSNTSSSNQAESSIESKPVKAPSCKVEFECLSFRYFHEIQTINLVFPLSDANFPDFSVLATSNDVISLCFILTLQQRRVHNQPTLLAIYEKFKWIIKRNKSTLYRCEREIMRNKVKIS